MDKEYDVEVNLKIDGRDFNGSALISFAGANTKSMILPETNRIKLSDGNYNVSVMAYGNSSLTIPGSTKTQCTNVAQSGLGGLFGATKEECFDIAIPETKIDYALIGGGREAHYILAEDLAKGKITISVDSLPLPSSITQLQNNFEAFDSQGADINYG